MIGPFQPFFSTTPDLHEHDPMLQSPSNFICKTDRQGGHKQLNEMWACGIPGVSSGIVWCVPRILNRGALDTHTHALAEVCVSRV
jgi:hypothetical protein